MQVVDDMLVDPTAQVLSPGKARPASRSLLTSLPLRCATSCKGKVNCVHFHTLDFRRSHFHNAGLVQFANSSAEASEEMVAIGPL